MIVIADLLEKKHRLYGRLKENMQSFKGALERGEESRIAALSREREELLEIIDTLDRRMARAGYPAGIATGPGNGTVPAWMQKIKEVWQDIFHLNLECLQFAEVRCRDLKTEMAAVGREVQNVKRYMVPRPYTPRFIDTIK